MCWGCTGVLCVLFSVVLCCVLFCVRSVCVLCWGVYVLFCMLHICVFLFSVHVYMFAGVLLRMCYFLCVCVRMCGRYSVEVFCNQSDTPLYGYLCGYRVRIIKAKKTQPLIKLKSLYFSTFLLCFKIMLLLSEKNTNQVKCITLQKKSITAKENRQKWGYIWFNLLQTLVWFQMRQV